MLVVGAGEMGKLTAQHLKAQGVERMLITSRTLAHATALADVDRRHARVPWDETERQRSARPTSSSPPPAPRCRSSTRPQVEAVMRPRRNRPLFIIDIALPRDVDPAVGDLESVFLYNIDDLQAIVQENLTRRAAEVARAEAIVADEVKKFETWLTAARPRFRRSSRCGSGSRRSGAPSSTGSSRSWQGFRPRRGRAWTRSRACSSRSC